MKKFYALALAASFVLSASAQTLTGAQQLVEKKADKTVKMAASKLIKESAELLAPAKAPSRAGDYTIADICGDYEVSYFVELENGGAYSGEMTVTAGSADNTVVLNIPFENGGSTLTWKVTASVDLASGNLTISKDQATGFTGAAFAMEHWNGTTYVEISEIVATFNGKAIVFDEDDAMGLQAASGGYYTFFDMITMDKIIDDPNADPNEGWTSVGNAKFVDPWVISAFTFDDGSDQWDKEYEVELQQNNLDKNLYRLVDPYKGNFPLVSYNESTAKHGYIQFNISDPDHVWFDAVESGFANSEMGITKMYCYNYLGWAVAYLEYDAETIVAAMGDKMHYTTYKDGVINLESYQDQDSSGNTVTAYDACFGVQGNVAGGYSWTGGDMTGRITFPGTDGVSNVVVDNSNAAVEYFNLQGQRVAEPAKGGLYIKRQGTATSKVVF